MHTVLVLCGFVRGAQGRGPLQSQPACSKGCLRSTAFGGVRWERGETVSLMVPSHFEPNCLCVCVRHLFGNFGPEPPGPVLSVCCWLPGASQGPRPHPPPPTQPRRLFRPCRVPL